MRLALPGMLSNMHRFINSYGDLFFPAIDNAQKVEKLVLSKHWKVRRVSK